MHRRTQKALSYLSAALEHVSSDLFTSVSRTLACSGACKGMMWMAMGLLCCGTIHRHRAEMCRPQANQPVAGRRTGVPVSSQGMRRKWHLKAKPQSCRCMCEWYLAQGGSGWTSPHPLPDHPHFPSQHGDVSLAAHPHLHSRCPPDVLPIPALAGHNSY